MTVLATKKIMQDFDIISVHNMNRGDYDEKQSCKQFKAGKHRTI